MSQEQLQFIDYRKPPLEVGDYVLDVQHKYGEPGVAVKELKDSGRIKLKVSGERVALNPDAIFAVYPPAGESGDFGDNLPHISLKKGSLPWIRSAYRMGATGEEKYEPWLYLLVLNEADMQAGRAKPCQSRPVSELDQDAFFPPQQLASLKNDAALGTRSSDLTTLDIQFSLFKTLIAEKKRDLLKMAHVRRRWQPKREISSSNADVLQQLNNADLSALKNAKVIPKSTDDIITLTSSQSWMLRDAQAGESLLELESDSNTLWQYQLQQELSVVLANRFAQHDAQAFPSGTRNSCFLVSLEQYFDDNDELMQLQDSQFVRLLVLHQWYFTCMPNPVGFKQRCENLMVDSLRLPAATIEKAGDFASRLQAGLTALPHQFRMGDRSVSWYRGPFVPFPVAHTGALELNDRQLGLLEGEYRATDADALLCYLEQDGMFDISYAAAYELGRFLSLSQPGFCQSLAQYKKAQARYRKLLDDDQKRRTQALNHGVLIAHLPYARLNPDVLNNELQQIQHWLLQLADFQQVPFAYLVPDKNLIPKGAIRTFNIDPKWRQSLWLGALSLGGRPQITAQLFRTLQAQLQSQVPQHGLLINSDLLWAYPQLQLDARLLPSTDQPQGETTGKAPDLRYLRQEKGEGYNDYLKGFAAVTWQRESDITTGCRLYLSRAPFNYLSLSLPPESLNYGATRLSGNGGYQKAIQFFSANLGNVDVPLRAPALGIVDMTQLASNIATLLRHKGHLSTDQDVSSARIGRFMLKPEPQAEYILGEEV